MLLMLQDQIFRRKRQSTGANFVHVHIEIRDKGILKFNKFSMYIVTVKLEQQCESLFFAATGDKNRLLQTA